MKKLTCFCGTNFEIDLENKIDLNKNPEISEQILENKFLEYKCPACGKLLKPEYKLEFSGEDLSLTMIPEIERDSLLTGKIELETDQVVVGYPELREKFIIQKFSYDDNIIELIKLYILKKINLNLDIRILFSDVENNNLIFHIFGLKENETGISKIPEHIYNSISENLKERLKDPEITGLLSLPYRSVNKISTEVN